MNCEGVLPMLIVIEAIGNEMFCKDTGSNELMFLFYN